MQHHQDLGLPLAMVSTTFMDPPTATVARVMFSDRNTDSNLVIMFNAMRLHVDIRASNLEKSPRILNEYLHYLKVLEAFELDGLTVDDFEDWVMEACLPTFLQLQRPNLPPALTLVDYLHPKTHFYTLCADNHNAFTLKETDKDPNPHLPPGTRVGEQFLSVWPSFTASQILIHADKTEELLATTPRKVKVEGNEPTLFLKHFDRSHSKQAKRELQTYAKLKQDHLSHLRVSRLFGVVLNDSGLLLGLLLSHIDCDSETLESAVRRGASLSKRQRWAAQITETLNHMHAAGIIWGDAKAANVLIDAHDDAYVVDFGGSYTEGWVERELAGTIEGDEQGLRKIVEYIFK